MKKPVGRNWEDAGDKKETRFLWGDPRRQNRELGMARTFLGHRG